MFLRREDFTRKRSALNRTAAKDLGIKVALALTIIDAMPASGFSLATLSLHKCTDRSLFDCKTLSRRGKKYVRRMHGFLVWHSTSVCLIQNKKRTRKRAALLAQQVVRAGH